MITLSDDTFTIPISLLSKEQKDYYNELSLIEHAKLLLGHSESFAFNIFTDAVRRSIACHLSAPINFTEITNRNREVVDARQVYAYFLHLLFGNRKRDDVVHQGNLSLSDIGRLIGNKDHSTVLHSCRTVRNISQTDKEYANRIALIWNDVKIHLIDAISIVIDSGAMLKKEEELHKAVVTYLKYQYPLVLFNSDLSGVSLNKTIAAKMSALRSRRGHPDLVIYEPRNGYYGLFIELKAEGISIYRLDGELVGDKHIREQALYLNMLESRGYMARFAIGFDEARRVIDEYLKEPAT